MKKLLLFIGPALLVGIAFAQTTVINGWGGSGSTATAIGFVMGSGAAGTDVGPELLAAHAGSVSRCVVRVKTSDATTPLTFRIKKNGVSVLSSDQTIAAAMAAGTTVNLTSALISTSISIAQDDVFTIDITSGTSSWAFVAQIE